MKAIWAPWRVEYFKQHRSDRCFICEMLSQRKDRAHLLLIRGTHCIALMNRFPYNTGHLMIAPRRHVGGLHDLSSAETMELMDLTREATLVLKKKMKPHGFNIGLNLGEEAGAGLKDHLHMHVVPRWKGDTNFMPVIGGVKVMPQSLTVLYDILHPAFHRKRRTKHG